MGKLYVLMSTESGGTVYYKSTLPGVAVLRHRAGRALRGGVRREHQRRDARRSTGHRGHRPGGPGQRRRRHRYYHGELSLGGRARHDADARRRNVTGTPTATRVALSWTASTDNVGGHRLPGPPQRHPGRHLDRTTSFTDTGLAASTAYSYTVTAVDAAGQRLDAVHGAVGHDPQRAGPPTRHLPRRRRTSPAPPRRNTGRPDLDGVHGQRRRHRLPDHPQRHPGRHVDHHELHRHRPGRLDDLLVHGHRGRRGGQRLAGLGARSRSPRRRQPTPPPAARRSFVGQATATGTTTSTSVAHRPAPQAGRRPRRRPSPPAARRPSPPPSAWTLVRTDANSTTMGQAVFVRAAHRERRVHLDAELRAVPRRPGRWPTAGWTPPPRWSPRAARSRRPRRSPARPWPAWPARRVLTFAGHRPHRDAGAVGPLTERSEITTPSTATYKVTADSADTTAAGTTAGPFTTTPNGSAGGIGQTVALRPRRMRGSIDLSSNRADAANPSPPVPWAVGRLRRCAGRAPRSCSARSTRAGRPRSSWRGCWYRRTSVWWRWRWSSSPTPTRSPTSASPRRWCTSRARPGPPGQRCSAR